MTWFVPLLARAVAGATALPVGLITMLALYGLLIRRATSDRAGSGIASPGIAQP